MRSAEPVHVSTAEIATAEIVTLEIVTAEIVSLPSSSIANTVAPRGSTPYHRL
jgi:hypothetical protein